MPLASDNPEQSSSTSPFVSWEKPFYPDYFFSESAFQSPEDLLRDSDQARPEEGTKIYDLMVSGRVAKEAVTKFTGQGKYKELAGLCKLKFASADAWFEEDERIYIHPKDPYKVCRLSLPFSAASQLSLISMQSESTCSKLLGVFVSR